MIYVPLYDTLGEPAIVHIINQSMRHSIGGGENWRETFLLASLKTVFVDKPENVLTVLNIIKQVPTLKRIVLTKKFSDEQEKDIRNKAKAAGIEIMKFDQLRVRFSMESFRWT